jgi:hypothetical protein
MRATTLLLGLSIIIIPAEAYAQDRDKRIAHLERQLADARNGIAGLQKTVESISTEMQALRQPESRTGSSEPPLTKRTAGRKATRHMSSPAGLSAPTSAATSATTNWRRSRKLLSRRDTLPLLWTDPAQRSLPICG